MFGLQEAQFNIVKSSARRCAKEIKDVIQQSGAKYDDIAAGIIDQHHEPIKVLITRLRFVWLIGYMEGRFGSGFDYE